MNMERRPLVGAGEQARKHKFFIALLTFFSAIGGFLFGYDTGVISGALPFLRDDLLTGYADDRQLQNFMLEVIVSIAIVGAGIGSIFGGWMSDRIGRKKALVIGDLHFIIGAVVMAMARDVSSLIVGRALVGVGIGLASAIVPVYIAECCPGSVRATLVTVNIAMVTGGQFVAYLFDYMFTYIPGTWRWMLGIAAVPAVVQMAGLLAFLPESPRWLVSRGLIREGRAVLKMFMPTRETEAVEQEIEKEIEKTANGGTGMKMLSRPEVREELAVGVGLQVLQQLCGINTIMYYTPTILEIAGYSDKRSALLIAMLPAAVNAIGTLIGMWAIDRVGRRKLALGSLAGVVLALTFLTICSSLDERQSPLVVDAIAGGSVETNCTAKDCQQCLQAMPEDIACVFCMDVQETDSLGVCLKSHGASEFCPTSPEGPFRTFETGCPGPFTRAIVAGLVLYLAAFSPGMGPVPWAVNAEIYPMAVRGAAGGAAATGNWATNYVVSQLFLSLVGWMGTSGTFLLYALISACGWLWVWWILPETRSLSLEEIQQKFVARAKERAERRRLG